MRPSQEPIPMAQPSHQRSSRTGSLWRPRCGAGEKDARRSYARCFHVTSVARINVPVDAAGATVAPLGVVRQGADVSQSLWIGGPLG